MIDEHGWVGPRLTDVELRRHWFFCFLCLFFNLKERGKRTILIPWSIARARPDWSQHPGTQSHVNFRNPVPWAITCCPPGVGGHYQEAGIRNRAGTWRVFQVQVSHYAKCLPPSIIKCIYVYIYILWLIESLQNWVWTKKGFEWFIESVLCGYIVIILDKKISFARSPAPFFFFKKL